jgi:hypothetical protein
VAVAAAATKAESLGVPEAPTVGGSENSAVPANPADASRPFDGVKGMPDALKVGVGARTLLTSKWFDFGSAADFGTGGDGR